MTRYLIFYLFFFLFPLHSNSDANENYFYAISSIKYYLENLQSKNREKEKIEFDFEDAEILWAVAKTSPCSKEITRAHKYYSLGYKSQKGTKAYESNIERSLQIINILWESLTNNYFHQKTPLDDFYLKTKSSKEKPQINLIKHFLLPRDHDLKLQLDTLFQKYGHALRDKRSFAKAGFKILFHQPWSYIIVASHPNLKGHLIKCYLESERRRKDKTPGWQWLIKRCIGAENIRQLIQKKGLKYFTVPNKWLYKANGDNENMILIVTDMQLTSLQESEFAWKNKITTDHLKELYCILSHGYSSCQVLANIPYTKNGTFACIDTEYIKRTLNYEDVKPFLSEEMKAVWDELVRSGGNI